MRKGLAMLAGLAILLGANLSIWQRERLIESGTIVRLALAPVDPRSLMQGDYMALRFQVANEIARNRRETSDGHVVVKNDSKGVASFVRLADATPLAAGETLLRYRIREGAVKFATNAWFFQEGHADEYAKARFGEFRVSAGGEMLLVAMLDENLVRLGPASR